MAVAHVARQLGLRMFDKLNYAFLASRYWHSPPERVYTVLTAEQGGCAQLRPYSVLLYSSPSFA